MASAICSSRGGLGRQRAYGKGYTTGGSGISGERVFFEHVPPPCGLRRHPGETASEPPLFAWPGYPEKGGLYAYSGGPAIPQ